MTLPQADSESSNEHPIVNDLSLEVAEPVEPVLCEGRNLRQERNYDGSSDPPEAGLLLLLEAICPREDHSLDHFFQDDEDTHCNGRQTGYDSEEKDTDKWLQVAPSDTVI